MWWMPTWPSYFDTIPHEALMARVEDRISDGRILDLLRAWLRQDVVAEIARWTPTRGSPRGAVISPLLGESVPARAGCTHDPARLSDGSVC
ncbi:MAG: hypothetical protein U5S82_00570 [Gammaproteobacteria bacterium]|nr:hypothetical protein [Gammaproteobacteria bacterium]